MGATFERTKIPGSFPVFWRGEFKVLPGGFKLKQTFPEGTMIPKGTPIQLDFNNLEAGVVKVAKVLAGGTTTAPRVTKGTLLQVGDTVAKVGKTDLSRTISAIDRTNTDYDVISFNGAMTTLAEGDFVQESTAYSADPATEANPLYVADAVVETTYEYTSKGFQTVSAGYEGLILKDVAYPVPSGWLNGYSLKANPSIKYIRQ